MGLGKAWLPAGIFVAGSIALSVVVFAKPKPEMRPPQVDAALVSVEVTKAESQGLRLSVTAQGTVVPRREIDIVAQVGGQVVGVGASFVDGGFFEDGEQLLQLDTRDYDVAVLSAKARLADAQRKLAEEQGASRQAKREWRDLGNQTANDLFVRKPQLASAQAALTYAEADLAHAELNLARTKIVAPYAKGRIKQTSVDLGQYVTAGTRLATVYDSSVIEVRVPLTEQQAALIDLPFIHKASAAQPSVVVSASVAGRPYRWEGVLTRTDSFVDPDTRMYFAIIEVEDPFAGAPLLPGLFVDVDIEGRALENVFVLPRKAIFERNKVYALDADNVVVSHDIQVLRRTEDMVWLTASIPNGALIALEKQSLIAIGSAVAPNIIQPADDARAVMVAP